MLQTGDETINQGLSEIRTETEGLRADLTTARSDIDTAKSDLGSVEETANQHGTALETLTETTEAQAREIETLKNKTIVTTLLEDQSVNIVRSLRFATVPNLNRSVINRHNLIVIAIQDADGGNGVAVFHKEQWNALVATENNATPILFNNSITGGRIRNPSTTYTFYISVMGCRHGNTFEDVHRARC